MLEVRNGALEKLAPLFERHHTRLYNYYVRMTNDRDLSEDLVQDVFLRILKYRHTFRGDGQFTTWMFRIARHVQIDYSRRWTLETKLDEDRHDRADHSPTPGAIAEHRDNMRVLEQALAQLTDEKRELLVLSRYQGMKYTEIAAILGCRVENVKVRVHRAVNDLRRTFFEIAGEPET